MPGQRAHVRGRYGRRIEHQDRVVGGAVPGRDEADDQLGVVGVVDGALGAVQPQHAVVGPGGGELLGVELALVLEALAGHAHGAAAQDDVGHPGALAGVSVQPHHLRAQEGREAVAEGEGRVAAEERPHDQAEEVDAGHPAAEVHRHHLGRHAEVPEPPDADGGALPRFVGGEDGGEADGVVGAPRVAETVFDLGEAGAGAGQPVGLPLRIGA
ncbi:hypothetical protein R1T08_13555 [Streptomyces sp. SBC-4]|nr:hypothetical protein [Streptomyces sp. SBC-4]MDV5145216.1 hypothetical protein [Streptomyces sp. SBC-4]